MAVYDVDLQIEDREFVVLVRPFGWGRARPCGRLPALRMYLWRNLIRARLVNDMASKGRDVPPAGSWPELDLLSAIIPFQFLGWHLAREKGVVPEKMRYPGLSQKLKIKTRVGT